MTPTRRIMPLWLAIWLGAGWTTVFADSLPPPAATFRVATYNVENWLRMERQRRPDRPKPEPAKQAVLTVLAEVKADVLALQEMGDTNDLAEVADGLAARGLVYPHREWLRGADPVRHVALLSRFPITDRFSRSDYTFTLGTNVIAFQRGVLDVNIRVHEQYAFRALVVHLKSRREVPEFDQAQARLNEAQLLRAHIGKILKEDHERNLLAMGDFNDTPDSAPVRAVIGESPFQLVALPAQTGRGYTGTHLWRGRREWSRIDYLIASPGMAREYVTGSARVGEHPASETASDHRPVWADFVAEDRAAATPD